MEKIRYLNNNGQMMNLQKTKMTMMDFKSGNQRITINKIQMMIMKYLIKMNFQINQINHNKKKKIHKEK